MSPRGRKRRRSEEDGAPGAESSANLENGAEVTSEKEREMWDAFRDEYSEALEQLPLTIRRQFALVKELDEQANRNQQELLPTLRKYIELRESFLGQRKPTEGATDTENPSTDEKAPQMTSPTPGESAPSPPALPNGEAVIPVTGQTSPKDAPSPKQPPSIATPQTPTTIPIGHDRLKQSQTTRQLLAHLAWLSEEILHATEEKVNLSQTAHDSVDRHIRLLDQAIKEQETSISIGLRPGTHAAPVLLPEIQVPRWSRPTRIAYSPPAEEDLAGIGEVPELTLGIVTQNAADIKPGKAKGKRGRPRKIVQPEPPEITSPEKDRETSMRRSSRSTLKPATRSEAAGDVYCHCKQGFHGVMVACDGKKCEIEWFHLACAGLNEAPKGKWYCRDCQRKK